MLCPGGAVWAQRPRGGMGRMPRGEARAGNELGGRQPKGPGQAIEEFQRMSPREREKALSKLPPERQQKLREQLQRYDALPQARKEQLQRFWKLPPEKQERVRERIRFFNQATPDRKQAMRQQMQQLQGMSEKERKTYFKSDEFKSQFTHEEQDTLKTLSDVLPPE